MTPADVLDRAAIEIERRGHCKNALEDAEGRVCSYGAICKVTLDYQDAAIVLKTYIDDDYISLWNNAPERTAEEVTSTMRAAAALWRARNEQTLPVPAPETVGA